jgi:hypothetical protein
LGLISPIATTIGKRRAGFKLLAEIIRGVQFKDEELNRAVV